MSTHHFHHGLRGGAGNYFGRSIGHCGMAVGMIATIAIFALAAVLLHDRFMMLLQRTDRFHQWIGRGLEFASAIMIIFFGVWLLATR